MLIFLLPVILFPAAQCASVASDENILSNQLNPVVETVTPTGTPALANAKKSDVLFFTKPDFQETPIIVNLDPAHSCHVVQDDLKGRVRSVNTNQNCIEFFDEENCKGVSRHVFPGAEFPHTDLKDIRLVTRSKTIAEDARSFRRCIFQDPDEDPKRKDWFKLFTETGFKGEPHILYLNPDHLCTNLGKLSKEVVGVDTNGYCVEFFKDKGCDPEGGTRHIFPGTEFNHADLTDLPFIGRTSIVADSAQSYRRCIFS